MADQWISALVLCAIEADNDSQLMTLLELPDRGEQWQWHPPQVWNDECVYGNLLLFVAIRHGSFKCIDAVLTRMPYLNPNKTYEELTPFGYAIVFKQYECAKVGFIH